ncbi:MAG: MarC family protein [Thermodesulfovibrionales bacterium]|nr:MarC family protein [Thermodesulfovibrionales bacterium]
MEKINLFLLSIIPLMVAINAPGVLPIYISMTEHLTQQERKKLARQSVITASMVTVGFIFVGNIIFSTLSIQVEDFMIAGGILLLIISISDMLKIEESKSVNISTLGVVPLGTPLIAGPATLTTSLILVGNYGYLPVISSLFINLFFTWLILHYADSIIKLMGINGSRAFAKVSSLLLAAIAVKLIRSGIMKILE